MSSTSAPVEVAVRFIEAFGRRDLAGVADCLAADVVFESPRVRLAGRDEVLAAFAEFAAIVESVQLTASFGDRQRAVIVYEMVTGPFGIIRATDHLTVTDGKISSDTLIFDTAALAPPVQPAPPGLSMISYRVAPDRADENQRLIESVFADLNDQRPDVSYRVLRLDDGAFVHLVGDGDTAPLTGLAAFAEFQRQLGDRVVEPPTRTGATVIGSYGSGS